MDGIRQLQQVVLAVGVVEVVVGEMAKVQVHGQLLAMGEVVDAHAGNDGSALGLVLIVGHDGVGGVGLGALQEVGQGVGDTHTVLEHIVADLQRLKKVLEFGFAHSCDSSLIVWMALL